MRNIFTKHPRTMNESYLEHGWCACVFGVKLIAAGVACIMHGIFPFVFAKTGSNLLFSMVQDYIERAPQVESRAESLARMIEAKRLTSKG